jgi:hypothetical protein
MTDWSTPKDAVEDVLAHLGDADAVESISISAYRARGQVYCTTKVLWRESRRHPDPDPEYPDDAEQQDRRLYQSELPKSQQCERYPGCMCRSECGA